MEPQFQPHGMFVQHTESMLELTRSSSDCGLVFYPTSNGLEDSLGRVTMLEEDEDIFRRQAEEDIQLFGARPKPQDPEEYNEAMQLDPSNQKRKRAHSETHFGAPSRKKKPGKEQLFSPSITGDDTGETSFDSANKAIPAIDWNSGETPLKAWLNQSALPSTGLPEEDVQANDVRRKQEATSLEGKELEFYRKVHIPTAPEPVKVDPGNMLVDEFEALEPGAQIYCRNILDRFPRIPRYLARRLAEANLGRAKRLEGQKRLAESHTEGAPLQGVLARSILWGNVSPHDIRGGNWDTTLSTEVVHKSIRTGKVLPALTILSAPNEQHTRQSCSLKVRSSYDNDKILSLGKVPPALASLPTPNEQPTRQSCAKDDLVPLPLPPPRFIADPDIAVQFGKGWREDQKSLPSINPGSSLLGGFIGPRRTDEPRNSLKRRSSFDNDKILSQKTRKETQAERTDNEPSFWASGMSSHRPASVHSRSSSMNSSLRGPLPQLDPLEQNPTFHPPTSFRRRLSSASMSAQSQASPGLPPPPVELGKVFTFPCDICGQVVKVKRRREWQYASLIPYYHSLLIEF